MAAELNSQREDELDEIVLAYLKALDAGQTPDPQEILACHPEFATELAAFFEDQEHANQFSLPALDLGKEAAVGTHPGTETAPDGPLPSTVAYQPESRERYTIIRFHAGGGIGDVYLAQDGDLGRQVALKELKPKFADIPMFRARFLEEARITGQLEHPGIVPVHEVTRRAGDQKPFYTMRFIKGRTLAHAIKAYHCKREAGQTGPLDLRELLNVFVGVCNAVAYAHSRGVIHRDLKPQNVALGDFGEALVLDWGLAKVLGEKNGEDSQPPVSVEPEAERGETMSGQRIGTISYMAPEQAEGRIDLMDRRTDVYGLGAILYEILTGEPPFTGPEESVVLDRVKHEAAVPPRQRVPATSPALELVCAKAIAKKREERYGSAKELAQEIERYLADEPVSAYSEPWLVRARRWLGKHRTFATATGAAVIVATVSLAVSTLFLKAANDREQQSRAKAESNLENFHQAAKAIDHMLNRVGMERLARLPQTEIERKELLEEALSSYQLFLNEDSDDPEILQVMGLAYQRTAGLYQLLGKREEARKKYDQGVELQTALWKQFPDRNDYQHDLAVTRLGLGDLLHAAGQNRDAETSYEEARGLLEPWARDPRADPVYQKTLAAILNSLGELYAETNQKEPEHALLDALTLRKAMVGSNPRVADYQQALARSHNSLGRLYQSRGQSDMGAAAHGAALEILKQLVDHQPAVPDFQIDRATTFSDRGFLYWNDGRMKEAMADYQQAYAIRFKLKEDHPQVPAYQNDWANSYLDLGVAYDLTNQHVEAEKSIRHGLDILEPLVKKNADEIKFAISLAHGYHELARSLQLTDRRQTALEMFPKSVNILEEVLKKEPYHVEARKSLADTHMFRAEVLVGMGRHSEAIEDWKQIVDLSEGQNVAILQSIRAIALARMGEHTRAVHEVQDMIQHLLPSNTCIYNYACVFSICSKTVMQDEQLSKAERSRQAETYQSLAMKHLKVLHDKGFLESGLLAQLRQDVDLDPLREYEDFKKLLDELEEEMKKRPAKGKNGERD